MRNIFKYWVEFQLHYTREGRSEVTLKKVKDALNVAKRRLGIKTIEECNSPRILREALVREKEKAGWSSVTHNSYLKRINTYFLWLENMEYIGENKIRKIRKHKEEQNEQYVLNEEQVKALVYQVSTRKQTRLERWRNKLFVELLVYTGARPCEMIDIQCKDVKKLEKGYKIIVNGRKQKGKPRYYELPDWLVDTYEIYIDMRRFFGREESNLFVSSCKRTGWTQVGMRGLFKRLSKELGFKVNAYAIRRFVATKLNAGGMKMKDIMNYLGHTRATTTQKYIERSCTLTKDCGDLLGGILNG